MQRGLEKFIQKDLADKIVLVSGPRQVGKTTLAKGLFSSFEYLNYDSIEDRLLLMKREWNRNVSLVIFDELHKMKKWKSWVKGIFDKEGSNPPLIVTGSARLNTYRKGGDSLAGRHFLYRLHPFTLKELKGQMSVQEALSQMLRVGGFPQPFLKGSEVFAKRWRKTHSDIILREDLLDLERIRDIKGIEMLIALLRVRVGSTTSYASLAEDLQISIPTVKHWIQILENLFIVFSVRPYHRNVARSLLKEAKYYFYDTGAVMGEQPQKLENLVACALLAELHFREDTQGEDVELCYLRDKDKREVDFLCVVDRKPSCMIEVKWSAENFDPALFHFQKFFKDLRGFQVVYDIKRPKSSHGVHLIPVQDFLTDMNI